MQQDIVKKICFIGNVDSGKSTTSGHLYALTGQLSEHELSKIVNETEKKYQMWSRVLDIYNEEREKGKTHEFNLLSFEYQGEKFTLTATKIDGKAPDAKEFAIPEGYKKTDWNDKKTELYRPVYHILIYFLKPMRTISRARNFDVCKA